ncbi:hypothetical protein [Micromonospora sp. DT63]|uniref:hypothetical protein n=1 Tax=Micromonospora sp. DT63 TaxID=3393441 RepID=UPI003CEEDB59
MFTDSLHIGFIVAAIGTLIGGLFALLVLPGRRRAWRSLPLPHLRPRRSNR